MTPAELSALVAAHNRYNSPNGQGTSRPDGDSRGRILAALLAQS
jgi:hypothetical protein